MRAVQASCRPSQGNTSKWAPIPWHSSFYSEFLFFVFWSHFSVVCCWMHILRSKEEDSLITFSFFFSNRRNIPWRFFSLCFSFLINLSRVRSPSSELRFSPFKFLNSSKIKLFLLQLVLLFLDFIWISFEFICASPIILSLVRRSVSRSRSRSKLWRSKCGNWAEPKPRQVVVLWSYWTYDFKSILFYINCMLSCTNCLGLVITCCHYASIEYLNTMNPLSQ